MNKKIGLQLVVYSLLLAGLSYLIHNLAPGGALPALITGWVGGALCLVWGAGAMAGFRGKALPILTLIPVSYVLLPQTFMRWSGESREAPAGVVVALLTTLLLLLSLGMMARIAWAGVVFDVPGASPTQEGGAKAATAGNGPNSGQSRRGAAAGTGAGRRDG